MVLGRLLIKDISENLPEDIKIITTYDRSELIEKAVNTLKRTVIEESIIVLLVVGIPCDHYHSTPCSNNWIFIYETV